MSASGPTQRPSSPAGGRRYQRSAAGMVGAMVVTVLVVIGFVVFRGAFRDNRTVATPTVPYRPSLTEGRAEGELQMLAPSRLPAGWRATSASYVGGRKPHWHLGLLRGSGQFLGLDESRDSLDALVRDHVDADARTGADVPVRQDTWKTFSDAGGDHALGRTLTDRQGQPETVLVYGNVDQATLEDFAASLTTG